MSLLHRKHISVKKVALCNRMDLIAIFDEEGSLSIFRTISWEKILSAKYTDDVEFSPMNDIISKFSPSGNSLIVGGKSLSLLNISNHQFAAVGEDLQIDDYYTDIEWIEGLNRSKPSADNVFDNDSIENASSLEKAYLLVGTSSMMIVIYQYGIIPIIQVQSTCEDLLQYNFNSFQSNFLLVSFNFESNISKKGHLSFPLELVAKQFDMANVIFELKHHIQSIRDSQNNMTRKWREALRVFPPKVELMNSALRGYEMNNGIIDFLHSIVFCGLWHPVASVIFTQHWNEQNLFRLRSSLDSTMKYIQRTIQLQIIPSIESMVMLSRLAISNVSSSWAHKNKWENFNSHCLNLLQASDILLSEVSKVSLISQKVLLFFRSCTTEAGGNTVVASHCALNPEDRILLQEVFNSERTVPTNNPEYLFGTSLLQLLSPDLPRGISGVAHTAFSKMAEKTLETSLRELNQLDSVPHFGRQLKAVIDAHENLKVVYEPESKQLSIRFNSQLEALLSSFAKCQLLAKASSVLKLSKANDPLIQISCVIVQKLDIFGSASYELCVWKQMYEENDMEEDAQIYRANLSGFKKLTESPENRPIIEVFTKKDGGLFIIAQDIEDTDELLVYNLDEESIEYVSILDLRSFNMSKAPEESLSPTTKLSMNGAKMNKGEYNEARGIFVVICTNSFLVFDANSSEEEEEEEEEKDENDENNHHSSAEDSSSMSEN